MNFDEVLDDLRGKKLVIAYTELPHWTPEDLQVGEEMVLSMQKGLIDLGLDVDQVKITDDVESVMQKYDPKNTLVFNWCEGFGDDGYDYYTVPERLEAMGIVYTGCAPACLKLTTDKFITKQLLQDKGIRSPKYKFYEKDEPNGWSTFPALCKPAREHSSYGITRESVVDNSEQMHKRIDDLQKEFECGILVEDFIEGSEFNVAVWGNEKLEVLPIGMIDFSQFDDYHDKLVGFDAKWVEGSDSWNKTSVACPAPIDETLKKALEDIAIEAYRACQCRDYARVDVRVRGDLPYVLEVNSNPDITTDGGFVRSSGVLGYNYPMTIAKILSLASKRLV